MNIIPKRGRPPKSKPIAETIDGMPITPMNIPVEKPDPVEQPVTQEIQEAPEQQTNENVRFKVVKEIPAQEIREHTMEDGTILNFVTIEEALTEFMNKEFTG